MSWISQTWVCMVSEIVFLQVVHSRFRNKPTFQMSCVEQSCSVELHWTRLLCYGRTFHFHLFPWILRGRWYYGPWNDEFAQSAALEETFPYRFLFKSRWPLCERNFFVSGSLIFLQIESGWLKNGSNEDVCPIHNGDFPRHSWILPSRSLTASFPLKSYLLDSIGSRIKNTFQSHHFSGAFAVKLRRVYFNRKIHLPIPTIDVKLTVRTWKWMVPTILC